MTIALRGVAAVLVEALLVGLAEVGGGWLRCLRCVRRHGLRGYTLYGYAGGREGISTTCSIGTLTGTAAPSASLRSRCTMAVNGSRPTERPHCVDARRLLLGGRPDHRAVDFDVHTAEEP